MYAGSPPRVWGRCSQALASSSSLAVHPHACGEDQWGRGAGHGRQRFTPTRVGKILTPFSDSFLLCPCVHRFTPTRVGKILAKASCLSLGFGSPPRVWGRCARE